MIFLKFLDIKNINVKYLQAINYLKCLLDIDNLDRIECYDISNLSGDVNVGSMVVRLPSMTMQRCINCRCLL